MQDTFFPRSQVDEPSFCFGDKVVPLFAVKLRADMPFCSDEQSFPISNLLGTKFIAAKRFSPFLKDVKANRRNLHKKVVYHPRDVLFFGGACDTWDDPKQASARAVLMPFSTRACKKCLTFTATLGKYCMYSP